MMEKKTATDWRVIRYTMMDSRDRKQVARVEVRYQNEGMGTFEAKARATFDVWSSKGTK